MRHLLTALVIILVAPAGAWAAMPPEMINYQGVLRDADGSPLDGSHDMVFHFYDAETGGALLLTDSHTATAAVTVSGGLFNVHLGGGTLTPAVYSSLSDVFANESEVWLEIDVGAETLSPRVRVIAAAYAINAGHLAGRDAGSFLDTSATPQTKNGKLVVNAPSSPDHGVEGYGPQAGGYFKDIDGSGEAYVGYADYGIWANGAGGGAAFFDSDSATATEAYIASGETGVYGSGDYGVYGSGDTAGGHFVSSILHPSKGVASVGVGWRGIEASGADMGGYFEDSDHSGYANVGIGNRGIEGYGSEMGGYFKNIDGSGEAYVGYSDYGIYANGVSGGATLWDRDDSGLAYIGYGDVGVSASGDTAGGDFVSNSGQGYARVGVGSRGIEAHGSEMGGYFEDSDVSATGYANVGIGNRGIEAYGSEMGGYFKDTDHSGYANVGVGDKGIEGFGSYMGGYFKDTDNTSDAKLAWGNEGIHAYGESLGGIFEDLGDSGIAYVAEEDRGIRAYGDLDGGYFGNYFSGVHGKVATDLAESTAGNGTKNFIQNHPYEKDKVIRYSSLEGDEVATFTRGTARLTGGEARVPLGATFRWVTNPDIGLTAHLTPHGDCEGLYVESLTTEELTVRERGGGASDVLFDYVVYGLRIGFEESSVVHEKPFEAYIPSMKAHLALYERRPELRDFNALERFKVMDAAAGRSTDFDFSRAVALRDAVEEYDSAIHGPVDRPETSEPPGTEPSEGEGTTEDDATSDAASRPTVQQPGAARILVDRRAPRAEEEPVAEADSSARFPASEPIEIGDILVLDIGRPGHLRPASGIADAAVFGIAAGEATVIDDETRVELVESRYAQVKADASYGAILPGDLLVSSPTPGHAMRAIAPLPGTIVGKAAEPLDSGTGLIRVLVMLR